SKFVQVGFSKNNRPSFLELAHNYGVTLRNEILENLRSNGGPNIFCIDIVLQRNGNSVQGPAITMPFAPAWSIEFGFCFLRLRKRQFRVKDNVRIKLRIEPLDAPKHQLCQLYRRKLPLAEKSSDLLDGGEGDVGIVHWSHRIADSN